MKPEVDENALHITLQFRSGDAMVYDLRGRAGRLTLRITGAAEDAHGPPTRWRIHAATSSSPDAVVVVEDGATRAAALTAVSRTWNEKRVASNLPTFDWDSVVRAMTAVRAI